MSRLFLFFFFVMPGVSCADVYKCVSQGKTIYSTSICGAGSLPYDRFVSSGSSVRSVQLSRALNGTFFIDGLVNGVGVAFMVDTGASKTVLSGSVAARLGIRFCDRAGYVTTANGHAALCSVNVQNLTVSGFNFPNVILHIVPSMPDGALLGSDLLSKFTIVQRGDLLTLSR